ncbi:MAG TPA: hypothetical protein VKR60_03330 [Candidatus Sulfotelmatobacter sp.]|nr:hypothetical protein [Candidatus Sulfotelmatobacter sp.]
MTERDQNGYIDWDKGREGYLNVPQKPVYAPVPKGSSQSSGSGNLLSIATETRLGSLIAAGGTIWAVYSATKDYADLWRFQILPPGPVEVCALGILVWLHAKWRRSTKVG